MRNFNINIMFTLFCFLKMLLLRLQLFIRSKSFNCFDNHTLILVAMLKERFLLHFEKGAIVELETICYYNINTTPLLRTIVKYLKSNEHLCCGGQRRVQFKLNLHLQS